MVSALEGDDSRFAAVKQGGFERRLNGFEPRVGKNGFAFAYTPAFEGQFAELAAKCDFDFGWMHIAHGVEEFASLVDERIANPGMSQACNPKGRAQVNETVSIRIPDVGALCATPKNGELRIAISHIA